MKNSVYVDIHAIQTVPPSCVNRDDTGAPKTAIYGGVSRARVSSQAWKRAMRIYFKDVFAPEQLGSRSKRIPQLIADAILSLCESYTPEQAMKAAKEALSNAGIKLDKKKDEEETAALFFISHAQIMKMAELAIAENAEKESNNEAANKKGKKDTAKKDNTLFKDALKDNPALDIALFGRMVADDPSLNYDAAAQVAHAISTHEVATEYDYFTAVDDENAADESGAGHLGTVEFNSSTLYRYATVNVTELKKNLGSETSSVIRGFVEAFARSMPTGKQNTFANRTLPDVLYVTIRKDQPVNLSGAFESAIRNTTEGYVKESCHKLFSHAQEMYQTFADKPTLALCCGKQELLDEHITAMKLTDLLDHLEAHISKVCQEESV